MVKHPIIDKPMGNPDPPGTGPPSIHRIHPTFPSSHQKNPKKTNQKKLNSTQPLAGLCRHHASKHPPLVHAVLPRTSDPSTSQYSSWVSRYHSQYMHALSLDLWFLSYPVSDLFPTLAGAAPPFLHPQRPTFALDEQEHKKHGATNVKDE